MDEISSKDFTIVILAWQADRLLSQTSKSYHFPAAKKQREAVQLHSSSPYKVLQLRK